MLRSATRMLSSSTTTAAATATSAALSATAEKLYVAKSVPGHLARKLRETADSVENPVLAEALRSVASKGTITHEMYAQLEDLVRKDQVPHDLVQGLATLSRLHSDTPMLPEEIEARPVHNPVGWTFWGVVLIGGATFYGIYPFVHSMSNFQS